MASPPGKQPSTSPATLPQSASPLLSSEDEHDDRDDFVTYHVFSDEGSYEPTHCGVFATRKEARAAAKEEVKDFCMENYSEKDYYEYYPNDSRVEEEYPSDDSDDDEVAENEEDDGEENPGDSHGEYEAVVYKVEEENETSEEEEDDATDEVAIHGVVDGKDWINFDPGGGMRLLVWVAARKEDCSLGDVWQVKAEGETLGIYNSRVGAVKAVLREKKARQRRIKGGKNEGANYTGEIVEYLVISAGLEVVAVKEDGSRDVVVKAEAWDLRN